MTENLKSDSNATEGLYIYGSGELDQLSPLQETSKDGDDILESPSPLKIPLHFISPLESIRSINCGQLFTLILSNTGNLYTFGCADNASLGHTENPKMTLVPLKFAAIGMGGGDCHGVAYDRENLAFWGQFRNSSGPIGEPCTEPMYFDRSQINGEYIKKVICGSNHVLILTEEKNVFAFGVNEFGQLGINPDRIIHHFQISKLLYENNIEDIYTGDEHSFLIKIENGIRVLKSWGNNVYGQLGIGSSNIDGNGILKIYTPTKVIFPGYPNISIKKVEGGSGTSICITEDNRVFVWGYNDFSILGLQEQNKVIPYPKELVFFNPFANPENKVNDVFACNQYFYARNEINNRIYSWGSGDSYRLGNKKERAESTPYLINNLFFKNLFVEDLALGCYHVVVQLSKRHYEDNRNEDKKLDIIQKEEIKPIKRKSDDLDENKEKEEDNLGIKALVTEEFITLEQMDQPKFSRKYKNYSQSQTNDNLNKIVEEEKNKVIKIEEDTKGKNSTKKTPLKSKKKQNSKSKDKNIKIDDDIEMKDETEKKSTKKISLENNKDEEKNKKTSITKNKKRSSSKKEKENEEEEKTKKENTEDKNSERKTNMRKIDLSNKKEKNKKEKNEENNKIENKEKSKDKNKGKGKTKDKGKSKDKNEEKEKEKEKEKSDNKNKEKEKSNNKGKESEKQEEKNITKEKEKSKSKNKKKKSSTLNEKEKEKEKSEEKDEKEKEKEEKEVNTRKKRKSKSKIKYPKEDAIEEIEDKKKTKKNASQKKSKKEKKEKKEEKEDENNENKRILRSNKDKEKEIDKIKEKEIDKVKEKSKKSIKSKSKDKKKKK